MRSVVVAAADQDNAVPESERTLLRVPVDRGSNHTGGGMTWDAQGNLYLTDQVEDSPSTPRGYDEFNRATGPGFFGWPYFVGANRLARFADYVNNTFGPAKDPARPVNTSRNNTGLRELPPAVTPLIELMTVDDIRLSFGGS